MGRRSAASGAAGALSNGRRGNSNADSLSSGPSGRDSAPSGRLPPHIVVPPSSASTATTADPSSQQQNQAQHCLVDGLVSFRQTRASRKSDGMSAKDRAGILSNLLLAASTTSASSSSSLPSKGSAFVLSVPVSSQTAEDDDHFARIGPVLNALGTHYNLLVVLAVSPTTTTGAGDTAAASNDQAKKLRAAWIARLRRQNGEGSAAAAARIEGAATTMASSVSADVLPSHRIVASTTVAGRVAFVRQVQRVGLVVDFDPTVHEQLSRFGHKVLVYDFHKL